MLYKKEEQLLLEECTNHWPKAYYEENDRQIRAAMLEKIEQSDAVHDEALAIRQQIWDKRYAKRPKQSAEIDYFVRGLVTLKSITIHATSLFGTKKCKKLLEEAKEDLCINLYENSDDNTKQVLQNEWKQLAGYYYQLCVEDRNFSTGVLGLMKLKDEAVISKIAEEVIIMADTVPKMMQEEDKLQPFSNCMIEVFSNTFYHGQDILAQKMAK